MKVVINRCYGGFGLSIKALRKLAEAKGHEVYFYRKLYRPTDELDLGYKRIKEDDGAGDICIFALKTDLGPNPLSLDGAEWMHERDFERNDPDLVRAVEELGADANGTFASLQVVEIPDGVEFEIKEYDGLEHVAETHRVWP